MNKLGYIFLVFILVFSSCSNDNYINEEKIKDNSVLFFYIATNSNLSHEGEKKVKIILEESKTTLNKDVYILKETRLDSGFVFMHVNDSKIDTINYDKKISHKELLQKATNYIKERLQNRAVNLIVFSHASGWYPEESSIVNIPKRAIIDDYHSQSLDDFYEGIESLHYNYIMFESCNMGGVEPLFRFHNICDYYISSSTEMLSPGFEKIYKSSFQKLYTEGPPLSFIEDYANFINQSKYPFNSATISICKTQFSDILFRTIKKNITQKSFDVNISKVQRLHRTDEEEVYYDIEDYINKSNLEDNFKSEVSNSLKKVVIYKFSTEKFLLPYRGFAIKSYSGLSINNIFGNTLYLNYYKKTAWGEYLFEN